MSYVGKVDSGQDDHLVAATLFGTCSTPADVAAKIAVLDNFDVLMNGVMIQVKFVYSNTASNPTLNVNNTGAKPIYLNGTNPPGVTALLSWSANSVLSFTYDGTAWIMNDVNKAVVDAVDRLNAGYNPVSKTSGMTKAVGNDSEGKLWTEPVPAADVQTAANTWLSANITNPDSPPLDRSLSSNASAAPADMVGDLRNTLNVINNEYSSVFNVNYTPTSLPSGISVSDSILSVNASAWSIAIWQISVEKNTDYELAIDTNFVSGIGYWYIRDLSNTNIVANTFVENVVVVFNSGNNNTIKIGIGVGASAAVYTASISMKKKDSTIAKIKNEIAAIQADLGGNLLLVEDYYSKSDSISVSNGDVILTNAAGFENIRWKIPVTPNTDYNLFFAQEITSGIGADAVYAENNSTAIIPLVSNTDAFTNINFNSGSNNFVFIRLGSGDAASSNIVIHDIYLSLSRSIPETINGKGIVVCWGDSLTAGAGASQDIVIDGLAGATMPSTLAKLLGFGINPNSLDTTGSVVYNMGVGGEDAKTIACRQGGILMFVNNITIPASGAVSFESIKAQDGSEIYPCRQNWYGQRKSFEPCTIAGISGNLTYSSDTDKYTFTRSASGSAVTIDRPTPIVTPGSQKLRDAILVIEIGHNGGYEGNIDNLIGLYRAIIDWNGRDKYIIIGDSNGTAESMASIEKRFFYEFGNHFFNNREYMSAYGMADAGLTPTADDLEKMAVGEIPLSLKVDSTHYNSYGYYVQGTQVYKLGKTLGYWE